MISTDQPAVFDGSLLAVFSSRNDGAMLDRTKGVHAESILDNRRQLCEANDTDYQDVVYQRVIYNDLASYDLLAEVDARSTTRFTDDIVADGLFTRQVGVGLFLPVADCIATVIYDDKQKLLALLHLGRHSTLTDLLKRTISKFVSEGSDLADLKVWMSPSAGRDSYRLDYFDHQDDPSWQGFFEAGSDGVYIDMAGYNRQVCLQTGIPESNIEVSLVDTMMDDNYFSHAGDNTYERMAMLVMMR